MEGAVRAAVREAVHVCLRGAGGFAYLPATGSYLKRATKRRDVYIQMLLVYQVFCGGAPVARWVGRPLSDLGHDEFGLARGEQV